MSVYYRVHDSKRDTKFQIFRHNNISKALFFVLFSEAKSHCIAQAKHAILNLAQTGLKFMLRLPQLPESWDCRPLPPCLVCMLVFSDQALKDAYKIGL